MPRQEEGDVAPREGRPRFIGRSLIPDGLRGRRDTGALLRIARPLFLALCTLAPVALASPIQPVLPAGQRPGLPEGPAPQLGTPTPKAGAGPGSLKVHFIDVGHGDSCLIQTPRGHAILVDGGNAETARGLVQYLRNAGVKRIAMMIASHPHSDHVGGLAEVARAFEVEMVLDPGYSYPTSSYRTYLKAVKSNKKTRFVIARAGQAYRIDEVRLSVLSPSDPLPADVNDSSIVCRLSYGDFSVMLTGDAGVEAERRVLRRKGGPIKSTVLKVAHHGSATSTSPPFLRAVAPEVAVISCKERDSQRWSPKAAHAIKARGIRICRTDHDGTIIVESDGKGYTLKTLGQGLDEDPPR